MNAVNFRVTFQFFLFTFLPFDRRKKNHPDGRDTTCNRPYFIYFLSRFTEVEDYPAWPKIDIFLVIAFNASMMLTPVNKY